MIFYNDVFRRIFKEQRWSHATLAKKSGLSRQSIGKWALGQVVPSEKNIRHLAHVLKVPASEISSYKDDIPVSGLKIANAVDSVLSYSEVTADELHKDYTSLIALATEQYKAMEQTSLIVKALLNSTPSISYIKDINSRYVAASKNFINNLGLLPGFDVLGKVDEDFFNKDAAEKNYKEDLGVILTGDPVIDKEDYILGTRKKKWGLISKTPVFENDKVVGVLGIITDITQRKRLERRDNVLTKVIKHLDSCILISTNEPDLRYKASFKMLFASDGFEKVFAVPKDVILKDGAYLQTILHPDDEERVKKWWSNECGPYITSFTSLEYRIILPDGTVKWIEDAVTPAGSMDGYQIRFGILTDITAKVKLRKNVER